MVFAILSFIRNQILANLTSDDIVKKLQTRQLDKSEKLPESKK